MPYNDPEMRIRAVEIVRERHRTNKACVSCGKPAAISRRKLSEGSPCEYCPKCLKRHKAWMDKNQAERLKAGLCVHCGKRPLATGFSCVACRDNARVRAKEMRLRLIELGRCVSCRREHDGPGTRCQECSERHNQNRRRTTRVH